MKVLIIDDDAKSRKILCDLLKVKNAEVVEAKTGEEAVTLVSSELTFVICDIKLPGIDGYEVARQIKEKYPQLPIIAHTASVLKEEIDKLAATELFDAVLLKPLQLSDYNKIVGRYL